jgi:hypothetical protein
MSPEQFGALLRERFPELRPEIDDGISTALVHLEMAALRQCAESAIERRDETTLRQCYQLAEEGLVAGTPDLQNAVSVSFVEDMLLFVEEGNEWAEVLLPHALRADLEGTRASYEARDRANDSA